MHSLLHVHYSNALARELRDTRVNRPSWKRSADRPRVLELRALTRLTRALENPSPDRKLSAFPLLERRSHVTARGLERLAQRPGIRRRLGGPRRGVWP